MRGSIASQACAAQQKCASFTVDYNVRVCEAHFCYLLFKYIGVINREQYILVMVAKVASKNREPSWI